jgi:hypothetical protein
MTNERPPRPRARPREGDRGRRVKTIAERVAELLATAPPITAEQREAVVRTLARARRTGDQEAAEQAARELYEAKILAKAKAVAAAMPALSAEKGARIAALLQGGAGAETELERVKVPLLPPLPEPVHTVASPPPERNPLPPIKAGVYFIRAGGMVKIGTSIDVAKRVAGLRTMSPAPLELLAVAKGGPDEEREVHRHFAHLRQHGEWFRAAPELLDYISQIEDPDQHPGGNPR